jgi:uncharacterized membrane protein YdjX (TVP38/TMEM64 family)
MRARGLLAITAARLVPLAASGGGVRRANVQVKLWHYTLGTFIGNLPGVFAANVYADQLAAALDDSSRINSRVVGRVVAVLAAGTWAVRRWLGNAGGARPTPADTRR